MIINEIMKKDVATCMPSDDLATASKIMHERRCGFLPVVTPDGAVAGVLTDRDICVHASDTSRSLAHIAVRDTMSRPVFGCLPGDNVKTALSTMAVHHVRRLPVLDDTGHLKGVCSIDDVISAPRRRGAPTPLDIVTTLRAILLSVPLETAPA